MKTCNERIGILQQSRNLSGPLDRVKIGKMVVVRWYLPHILKHTSEIIKYMDVCQHVNTYKLQKIM